MLKFIAGFGTGVMLVVGVMAFGPKGSEARARAAADTVVEQAAQAKYSFCKKGFNEETHCFQNKQFTQAQCGALLDQKCGVEAGISILPAKNR